MVLAVAVPVLFYFLFLGEFFLGGRIIANRDSACGWCWAWRSQSIFNLFFGSMAITVHFLSIFGGGGRGDGGGVGFEFTRGKTKGFIKTKSLGWMGGWVGCKS
jgi:hypothetical protein